MAFRIYPISSIQYPTATTWWPTWFIANARRGQYQSPAQTGQWSCILFEESMYLSHPLANNFEVTPFIMTENNGRSLDLYLVSTPKGKRVDLRCAATSNVVKKLPHCLRSRFHGLLGWNDVANWIPFLKTIRLRILSQRTFKKSGCSSEIDTAYSNGWVKVAWVWSTLCKMNYWMSKSR